MAESESGQEKTETATAKKRSQSREEGQVPKSTEVNTCLLLIAGVVACYNYLDDYWYGLKEATTFYIQNCSDQVVNEVSIHAVMLGVATRALKIIAPFFILFFLVSIASNLIQVGFIFTLKPLQPKPSKLNPISGIKRLFSARGGMELLKSIGKIFLIAPIMIYIVYTDIPEMLGISSLSVRDAMVHIGYDALELALYTILILIILAIIDFTYQRWQHEKDLRMTKEEVKQEMKDIQGDPQIKGRIRAMQREMARKRMMEEVPDSDVVVTNPTEYAIAIKYAPEENSAPIVVAKGKNLHAKRIKKLALEHDIPIVENRPLAQSLYKLADVGGQVPPELYQAIAEVLAYVYKLQGKISDYAQETA